MEQIREIVEYLDIPKKREELERTKRTILSIKQQMSDLTGYRNVASYAYAIQTLEFFNKYYANFSLQEKAAADEERIKLEHTLAFLETDEHVMAYNRLLRTLRLLEESFSDYHKTINIDLRTELLDLRIPEIYINQGFVSSKRDFKLCRNIIVPNTVITFVDPSEIATLISRVKDKDKEIPEIKEDLSYREAKKLYNKVSYRYLEGLTQDYSFDLEGKNLGNVIIHRRGR